MILHDYWRSSTSYRVRAGLNLKGVAYRRASVDLAAGDQHGAAYLALNPAAGVPALELSDGTVLTQSMAILTWLDATYPNPPFLPTDPLDRARVEAVAQIIASEIHPLNNRRVTVALADRFSASDAQCRDWMCEWMASGFAAIEAMLPADAAPFAFGPVPGLADICLLPQVYNAERWGLELAPYPRIRRVAEAARAHPAFAAAAPEAQREATSAA